MTESAYEIARDLYSLTKYQIAPMRSMWPEKFHNLPDSKGKEKNIKHNFVSDAFVFFDNHITLNYLINELTYELTNKHYLQNPIGLCCSPPCFSREKNKGTWTREIPKSSLDAKLLK